MALVLLVGTLNRVMIVELNVPAALVAVMVALPVLYAPLRALIGFRSDTHRSALGWRRVPFIWMGTLIQFGGFAVMPFALLVLSGGGESNQWPAWIGPLGAGFCFLMVGAGLHTTQTAGLALATDLASEESQPRVVGLMYVMLLAGTDGQRAACSARCCETSARRVWCKCCKPRRWPRCVLNSVALWKQEARRPPRGPASAPAARRLFCGMARLHRRRRHAPPPRRHRAGHAGLRHAGRAARAFRRPGARHGCRRDDVADGGARRGHAWPASASLRRCCHVPTIRRAWHSSALRSACRHSAR